MKKLIASVLGMSLVAALALTATSVTTAQLGDANYQGESLFHSFPSSVLFAGGYKQSLALNQELRMFADMGEKLDMFQGDEMRQAADMLDQLQEAVVIVAARDITKVNMDNLEENAEENICVAARVQMSEPLRSEFLADKPAEIMLEEIYGYTYLTTGACINHPNFAKQSDRIQMLNAAADADHTFYGFVNKGVLHGQFAKSEMAAELESFFNAETMMDAMYMYDENGDIDMQASMMLQGFLNTVKQTRLVAMASDSQRIFLGMTYKNGTLSSELDVEFKNTEFPKNMNEIFDGTVRAGKLFLTPQVAVTIQGKQQGNVSYNTVAYSNMDASMFLMAANNMMMPFFTLGMVGAVMAPSYDDYYYDEEMYSDEAMEMNFGEEMPQEVPAEDAMMEEAEKSDDDFFFVE